jgi:hypothetical protein
MTFYIKCDFHTRNNKNITKKRRREVGNYFMLAHFWSLYEWGCNMRKHKNCIHRKNYVFFQVKKKRKKPRKSNQISVLWCHQIELFFYILSSDFSIIIFNHKNQIYISFQFQFHKSKKWGKNFKNWYHHHHCQIWTYSVTHNTYS